jgi:hypothetical protein
MGTHTHTHLLYIYTYTCEPDLSSVSVVARQARLAASLAHLVKAPAFE